MPARFAIIGDPVTLSLSPILHGAAFQALGIDATYERLPIRADELPVAWEEQLRPHFDGFNVTLPLKGAVIPLLDRIDSLAASIGAVNTVTRRGNRLIGTNTDIVGVRSSVAPFITQIRDRRTVVIGAGATARTVTAALASDVRPSHLTFLARDPQRALGVARLASSLLSCPVEVSTLESPQALASLSQAGFIVQTTPIGMAPGIGQTPVPTFDGFHADQAVLEVIYRPLETMFMRRAIAAGCRVVGGLEFFLQQGAASFEQWLGRPMPLDAVRPTVLAALTS